MYTQYGVDVVRQPKITLQDHSIELSKTLLANHQAPCQGFIY